MLRNAVLPVHFPENRVIRFNVSSVTIEGWVGRGQIYMEKALYVILEWPHTYGL